jgi:hypothetical protein
MFWHVRKAGPSVLVNRRKKLVTRPPGLSAAFWVVRARSRWSHERKVHKREAWAKMQTDETLRIPFVGLGRRSGRGRRWKNLRAECNDTAARSAFLWWLRFRTPSLEVHNRWRPGAGEHKYRSKVASCLGAGTTFAQAAGSIERWARKDTLFKTVWGSDRWRDAALLQPANRQGNQQASWAKWGHQTRSLAAFNNHPEIRTEREEPCRVLAREPCRRWKT